jgi:AP-2 complex subunit mu-1
LANADPRRSISDVFRIQVISNADVRSPIITLGSTSFFHVRINNVYLVAVTKWAGHPDLSWNPRCNASAALVFEFLYRFVQISRAYFSKLDEESVKNNFVLIYELLDEIIDFGFPQNSEIDTLKMYITTESIKSEMAVVRRLSSLVSVT